jgi:hypothetical protein
MREHVDLILEHPEGMTKGWSLHRPEATQAEVQSFEPVDQDFAGAGSFRQSSLPQAREQQQERRIDAVLHPRDVLAEFRTAEDDLRQEDLREAVIKYPPRRSGCLGDSRHPALDPIPDLDP